MTNEEMQHIIEFMIRRQEVFSTNMERLEANYERLQANQERLQANQEALQGNQERLQAGQEMLLESQAQLVASQGQMQVEIRGLAAIVGRIGEAQIKTQNDVSNLAKIVDGLVQLVVKERNGDEQAQ